MLVSLAILFYKLDSWKISGDFLVGQKAMKSSSIPRSPLPPWQDGYLDIHHILHGSSVATFITYPDGTTMLIDTGDVDMAWYRRSALKAKKGWRQRLRAIGPWPDSSKSTAGWVVAYVYHFWPRPYETGEERELDYVLASHFHRDHIGDKYGKDGAPQEQARRPGATYTRTGLPYVGDEIRFRTLIDRDYPWYNFPRPLMFGAAVPNYVNFLNYTQTNLSTTVERFDVGSRTQFRMKQAPTSTIARRRYGHFVVRNIKSNDKYSRALPDDQKVHSIPGKLLDSKGRHDENEVSTAIVMEYGKFKYYTGGDQEYHDKIDYPKGIPKKELDFDAVTPTSDAAGKVDVAIMNHHGHGVRPMYRDVMDPKVVILQGWCSDQPPDQPMAMLVGKRKSGDFRHFFATFLYESRMQELDPKLVKAFLSVLGHVVVRVHPVREEDGRQPYYVYVLDAHRMVKDMFGPYYAER